MELSGNNERSLRAAAQRLSPEDVCAELLALCVVEFSYTPALSIAVELRSHGGTICDTGRGMRLTPDPGDTLSHAQRALTSIYPCLPASADIERGLRDLVWGERGSLGPGLSNAACPFFRFESRWDGELWSQDYRYGHPNGPPVMVGLAGASGTVVTFETAAPIDHAVVFRVVEDLRSLVPALKVTLRGATGTDQE